MTKICGSMWRGVSSGLLVAGMMMAQGCATEDGTDIGDSETAIAELDLANGSKVSFYETHPGAIAIAEDAPVGAKPVPTIGRSAVEVYESLAPGQPVPPALLAAQARADEARAARVHPNLPDEVIDATGASISDASFINTYCSGSYDVIQCSPLHRHTNTSSFKSDVDEAFYAACSNVGTVTLRASIGGDPWHSWDVAAGYCRYYHWTSGWLNDSANGGVINASGSDDYDFSARYNY